MDCGEDDTNPPGSTKYALLTVIRVTVYQLLCFVQQPLCILAKVMMLSSSPEGPDGLWESANLLLNDQREILLRAAQRPRREALHSPLFSAEVKNEFFRTSAPPHDFITHKKRNNNL